ncbi:hypothetical protein GCM10009547_47510 [Sporichthya brevicatena]|uniref:Lipoprotein n=1 Tax=Sporichthya brevicatena TaxID=171442 RepID=A0ABN1HC49_9ACTN
MPLHVRTALPALALATALALTGCGGSTEETPTAAAGTTPPAASAAAIPAPAASGAAAPAAGAKAQPAKATVAPEVVVPSKTDVRSQAALSGWQAAVVARLRQLDKRLVPDRAATIRKVRATCDQMASGMFETKVIPIIVKRFSTARITVDKNLASAIYAVLLQEACYVMNNET